LKRLRPVFINSRLDPNFDPNFQFPISTYWEILGTILKPHRGGSIVEVGRLRLPTFTVEMKELAEWFGLELCRITFSILAT
jgi:hypothetical protein